MLADIRDCLMRSYSHRQSAKIRFIPGFGTRHAAALAMLNIHAVMLMPTT